MSLNKQASPSTSPKPLRRDDHSSEFPEKLAALLASFGLEHENSILNQAPLDKYAEAIYSYYDGTPPEMDVKGQYFYAVMKAVLENCPADKGEEVTFEGALRYGFIELANPVLDDRRVFSEAEAIEIRGMITGSPLRRSPDAHVDRDALRPSEKNAFEELVVRYPGKTSVLESGQLRDHRATIEALYNGTRLPTTDIESFKVIMRSILSVCPEKSGRISEVTFEDELRERFIELYGQNYHKVKSDAVNKRLPAEFFESIPPLEKRRGAPPLPPHLRRGGNTPSSGGSGWTPAHFVVGIIATLLVVRYVGQPLYQWYRGSAAVKNK